MERSKSTAPKGRAPSSAFFCRSHDQFLEMDKPRILIVDDDDEVRTQMKWALCDHYDVLLADDRKSALEKMKQHRPAVVTLDLGLPPSPGDTREGFAALADLLHSDPSLKVIV